MVVMVLALFPALASAEPSSPDELLVATVSGGAIEEEVSTGTGVPLSDIPADGSIVINIDGAGNNLGSIDEPLDDVADKSALETAIADAESKAGANYTANHSASYSANYYTDDSWAVLAAALAAANAVLANDAATTDEVSAALSALNSAIAGLVETGYSSLTYADLLISMGSDESELMFTWYTAQASAQLAIRAQDEANFEIISTTDAPSGASYIHRATAIGLAPATTYEYRLIGEENTASDIFTVKTGNADSFRFIAVGDPQIGSSDTVNDTNGWVNTLSRVTAAFPDANFMLSAGDQVETANNTAQYTGYLKPGELKNLPLSNAVGNHDAGNALFTDHFQMPNATKVGTGATNYDWWYTYDNTLFMFIDANYRSTTAGHRSMMAEAIEANPDATWKVVVFHQGPYTNASHSDNDGYGFRTTWTPMFDDLGIDVVLNGHDHSYTRAFQMLGNNPQKDQQWLDGEGNIVSDDTGLLYDKVLNPTGTAYFELNSGSGSKFYSLKTPQYFVAKQIQSNTANFSIVDVSDESFTVTTYALDGRYNGSNHSVIDTYTIYKADTPFSLSAAPGEEKVTLSLSELPADATGAELQISTDDLAWQTLSASPLADGAAKGAYLSDVLDGAAPALDVLGLKGATQYYFKLTVTGGEHEGVYTANAVTEAKLYSSTFIERHSSWKYNDTNTDQGITWRDEAFNDSAWKTGNGPLGYPGSDSNPTFGLINSGTLVDNRSNPNAYITYYFRNTFDIAAGDLANIKKLDLVVGIDDGYVMYINGTEVRRLYMPAGDINWQTWATYVNEPSSAQGTDAADITAAALPLLKSGTNTIAVEVHNRDNTSSDIYFDMELTASISQTAPTVDKEALNTLITTAFEMTQEDYTAESWTAFAAAFAAAQQTAADSGATQSEIDTAVIILTGAMNALVAVPPTPGKVMAGIRVNTVSDIKAPVEFTVSLRGAQDAAVVALEFEVDGNKLGDTEIAALNGFETMGPIAWTALSEGLWQGKVTLVLYGNAGADQTSGGTVDIARLNYQAKELGDAVMKLTRIEIAGTNKHPDGNTSYLIDSEIETEEAKTSIEDIIVYSRYDLNKDARVDILDLALALSYCQYKQSDSEWEKAEKCDVNEAGGVIGDGEINMLDLLAIFLNYTN
jgi:hypothetical protein